MKSSPLKKKLLIFSSRVKAKEDVGKIVAQSNTSRATPLSQKSEKVEYKPVDTAKELAKIADVSHDTIAKVERI